MARLPAFLALIFAGCTFAPRHANVVSYEKKVHLSIFPATNAVSAGGQLQIDFALENTANEQLTVCRYSRSAVHFWGIEAKYAKTRLGPLVDHQYCEVKMNIAPHERVLWSEAVEVPSVQAGPSKVIVTVRLVDPAHCDEYGCYDALVSATAVEPVIISSGGNGAGADFGPPRG